MKNKYKLGFLLIASLLFITGCSQDEGQEEGIEEEVEQTEENKADEEVIAIAEEFIQQLADGQYGAATENLDETMAEQLNQVALATLWKDIESQLGELVDYEYAKIEEVDGYQVILITAVFTNEDANFQVTINENQEISGFFIV